MPETTESLIDALGATGRTPAQLARLLGVNWTTVDRWIEGERTPQGPAQVLLWLLARRPELADEIASEFGELT